MDSETRTYRTGDDEVVLDLTDEAAGFVAGRGDGLLHVFVPHATAGLAIIETGAGSDDDLLAALGDLLPADDRWRPGTINIILLVDGNVTESAMAGALVTATEAKAAALQDLEVTDPGGNVATGTSTDAVVIARIRRMGGPVHLYAGTVSPFGRAVARAVYDAVAEAVLREREREEGKDGS